MRTPLRLLSLVFAFITLTGQLLAQNCSTPGRYTANIFTNVDSMVAIPFGVNAAKNYSNGTSYAQQTLFLNFYQPAGDPATSRPLVILAFGGGFIEGDRSQMAPAAIEFAKKGYVVATIDYRLINTANPFDLLPVAFGDANTKMAALQDVIIKASADLRAAIRFLKYSQATSPNTYKIDTTRIFVGGASAGAIAALHAAYIDNVNEAPSLTTTYAANGGIEGNTKHPTIATVDTYTSTTGIAGVINIAGAILDTNAIDSNDPPVYSAQGDKDEVIPYVSGPFSTTVNSPLGGAPIEVNIPVTFYGAYSITQRAMNLGLKNALFTITDGTHESPLEPLNLVQIIAGASTFMQSIICGTTSPLPVTLTNFTVRGQNCAAVLNWQTATELQSRNFEVERSEDGVRFTTVATVASRNNANGAAYTYRLEGATKPAWYRLKMVDVDGQFKYSPAQRLTPQCGNGLTVSVYPNPAQAQATVSGLVANQIVSVIGADGKLLWSQKASGQRLDIPLSAVEKGLLLIQVKDETGRLLSSTKLVKN
jgi:predicted esterase